MKWRLERIKEVDVEVSELPADEMLKHWYWLIKQAEKLSEIEEAYLNGSGEDIDITLIKAFDE